MLKTQVSFNDAKAFQINSRNREDRKQMCNALLTSYNRQFLIEMSINSD